MKKSITLVLTEEDAMALETICLLAETNKVSQNTAKRVKSQLQLELYINRKEEIIEDVVAHYEDWTRSDLQGFIMAQISDFDEANEVLGEIDRRLLDMGVGI